MIGERLPPLHLSSEQMGGRELVVCIDNGQTADPTLRLNPADLHDLGMPDDTRVSIEVAGPKADGVVLPVRADENVQKGRISVTHSSPGGEKLQNGRRRVYL